MSPSLRLRLGCVALLLVLAFGCERVDPQARRITAPDIDGLARWRRSVATRYSPQEWREFDTALQQIRAQISAAGEARAAAVDFAMCSLIDGRTWHEIQVLGTEAEMERLRGLRAELKNNIDGNSLIATRANDHESTRVLRDFRERQAERLRDLDGQIAAVAKRRAALGGAEMVDGTPAATNTRALSRADARAQIATMIATRRARAQFRFGAWPVKFDRDGTVVTGEVRDEFLAARAAAVQIGDAVVGVHLKEKWWIFSGHAKPPQFGPAVLANLTAADREGIDRAWLDLEAELWARERAWTEIGESPATGNAPPMPQARIAPQIAPPKLEPVPVPIIVPEKPPAPRFP